MGCRDICLFILGFEFADFFAAHRTESGCRNIYFHNAVIGSDGNLDSVNAAAGIAARYRVNNAFGKIRIYFIVIFRFVYARIVLGKIRISAGERELFTGHLRIVIRGSLFFGFLVFFLLSFLRYGFLLGRFFSCSLIGCRFICRSFPGDRTIRLGLFGNRLFGNRFFRLCFFRYRLFSNGFFRLCFFRYRLFSNGFFRLCFFRYRLFSNRFLGRRFLSCRLLGSRFLCRRRFRCGLLGRRFLSCRLLGNRFLSCGLLGCRLFGCRCCRFLCRRLRFFFFIRIVGFNYLISNRRRIRRHFFCEARHAADYHHESKNPCDNTFFHIHPPH